MVSIVTNKQTKNTYRVSDLVPVINYVCSSNSLRGTESWTPICLPSVSETAFTYAYISFVGNTDVCQLFFSYDNSGQQFMQLSKAAGRISRQLKETKLLTSIEQSITGCPVPISYHSGPSGGGGGGGGPPSSGGGTPGASTRTSSDVRAAGGSSAVPAGVSGGTPVAGSGEMIIQKVPYLSHTFQGALAFLLNGIIHGSYFLESSKQYFSSRVREPYCRKYLFRNYAKCRELMQHCRLPSQVGGCDFLKCLGRGLCYVCLKR